MRKDDDENDGWLVSRGSNDNTKVIVDSTAVLSPLNQ